MHVQILTLEGSLRGEICDITSSLEPIEGKYTIYSVMCKPHTASNAQTLKTDFTVM